MRQTPHQVGSSPAAESGSPYDDGGGTLIAVSAALKKNKLKNKEKLN